MTKLLFQGNRETQSEKSNDIIRAVSEIRSRGRTAKGRQSHHYRTATTSLMTGREIKANH
jgi:hypothetical protein